jgi:hypothetical protein
VRGWLLLGPLPLPSVSDMANRDRSTGQHKDAMRAAERERARRMATVEDSLDRELDYLENLMLAREGMAW